MKMKLGMVMSYLVAVMVMVCPAQATILLEDGFESNDVGDDPAGWTIAGEPANGEISVTNTLTHSGNRSVSIDSTKNAGGLTMHRNFSEATNDILVAETWVYVNQTDKKQMALGIVDVVPVVGWKYVADAFFGTDGYFWYNEGGTDYQTTKSYNTGQWYHIKYVIDMDNTNWDFYVDGGLLASDKNWSDVAAVYPGKVVSKSWEGSCYIDDVKLDLIPEPMSLLLLGGGLTLLVFAQRRMLR